MDYQLSFSIRLHERDKQSFSKSPDCFNFYPNIRGTNIHTSMLLLRHHHVPHLLDDPKTSMLL
jgi:hypothetical protein